MSWDWAPDVWSWTPSQGRWAPEYGRPGTCVSPAFSTRGVRPSESYDCWREMVFYGWDADRPDEGQRRRFGASVNGLLSPRGDCFWYHSGHIAGRRNVRRCRVYEGDPITLGLVLQGCRRYEQDGDRAQVSGPGGWTFYDPASPSRTEWDSHSGLHLTLNRDLVRRVLGGDIPAPSRVVEALGHSRLSPFLASQLQLLASRGEGLANREQELILNQVIDLALATLETSPLGLELGTGNHKNRALLITAQAFMQRHLDNPDLCVDRIAAQLGCSRSTLYRVFAGEGLTVAGYLRDIRLQKVHRLLQTAPAGYTIADIAARCGFVDSASFSRLFKHTFGVSPKELRS